MKQLTADMFMLAAVPIIVLMLVLLLIADNTTPRPRR